MAETTKPGRRAVDQPPTSSVSKARGGTDDSKHRRGIERVNSGHAEKVEEKAERKPE